MNPGRLRILFAAHDDKSALRTKHVLDALGYEVIVRTSSGGVLTTFREHPDIWDLAIFDHSVSNMSGFDLEDVVHMIRPELKTLVLPPYGETRTNARFRVKPTKAQASKPDPTRGAAPEKKN